MNWRYDVPTALVALVAASRIKCTLGQSSPLIKLGEADRAWNRIHLVDGAVFPSVPATTFTLTVMANAHRIASESLTHF